jgi:DNA (cytosine-5)-methyltransferase 1
MIAPKYVNKSTAPKAIDLFSGAGGMSLGFLMAGGMPICAIDNDSDSIATYKKVFPMAGDSFLGKIEDWKPKNSISGIQVIIGGPPCQGFSLARGQRFVDDPRNHLFKEFVKAVEFYKPDWFVMENVQGILNIGGGIILEQILEAFQSIGYTLDYKLINTAEYGVPQLRKRTIFVGNKHGVDFEWPSQVNKKAVNTIDLFTSNLPGYISVNEALSDLYLPTGNFFSHRANSQMRGPRNRDAFKDPAFTLRVRGDEFALCEHPATSAFIPGPIPVGDLVYLKPETSIQDYFRAPGPKWIQPVAKPVCIKAEKLHLSGTRKLTITELARLQSFPDWVKFEGSVYSQARQIGNAVPPIFAYHLFKKIFSYL